MKKEELKIKKEAAEEVEEDTDHSFSIHFIVFYLNC